MEATTTITPSAQEPVKSKKGLTQKLVVSMLLVGALPLLIGLLLAFYQGTQSIQEVNGASFQALAKHSGSERSKLSGSGDGNRKEIGFRG
jgi:hypothetical protein